MMKFINLAEQYTVQTSEAHHFTKLQGVTLKYCTESGPDRRVRSEWIG